MRLLSFLLLSTLSVSSDVQEYTPNIPIVQVRNGSYHGVYNPIYNQEFFLGIPYAQPPVGNLRFRLPQSLNETWTETRAATEYGSMCLQAPEGHIFGSDDCLNINIVRPAGIDPSVKLPVLVYLHGGGFVDGSNSLPTRNVSFIVKESARANSPIIVASLNYRLHIFGFLWGSIPKEAGIGNLGLRDQRLGLKWIQENIESFGGDPTKVTIWGSSAGALSVMSHITAYGGRDDGLFRGGILASNSGFHVDFDEAPLSHTWDAAYQKLQEATGCTTDDSLQCLREVPSEELYQHALNITYPNWGRIIDGDFIQADRSELVRQGKIVPVPIIIGVTTNDGDLVAAGTSQINTTTEWDSWIRGRNHANNETIQILSALYPDIPRLGMPNTLIGRPTGELAHYGTQWKRALAFATDLDFNAPKRAALRHWASLNLTAYSYRFNVYTRNLDIAHGVGHYGELPFVLMNTNGAGYENSIDPFAGTPESYKQVAQVMGRMWISFANYLDPNQNGVISQTWPRYDIRKPQNIVFDANTSTLVFSEPDTIRTEHMDYLNRKMWHLNVESGM
ncbi:alpha/beta-hydrolase [Corynespora cassiicola Philippines]|uniref:Carboxylic ester hydrolase n=1 Tax=Corynespora cassiicola Philippines TaxID=1448308 RepID=A0A2T2NQ45_CORCC|nr:alpha/beta-hydrolase [Corynespora cassiicola Philippines]